MLKIIQKYFGQDAGRCKKCIHFAEIGSKHKEKNKTIKSGIVATKRSPQQIDCRFAFWKKKIG